MFLFKSLIHHQQTYSRQQVSMLPYAAKKPISANVLRFNDDGELAFASDPENGKSLQERQAVVLPWVTPSSGVGAATSDTFTNKTIDASTNTSAISATLIFHPRLR